MVRGGGDEQLGDSFIGQVVEAVRPHRFDGGVDAWRVLAAHHETIEKWLTTDGLTVVKVHDLLARRGVAVPQRTLHRYALEVCDVGRGRRGTTVRVAEGKPGDELQVDFGTLGRIFDPPTGRSRDCWALVFTPVVSRYGFVWLSFRQTTEDVIAGFEAAWAFYGGVFSTVIPDNLKAIVDRAHPLEPRLSEAFVEYAQCRGFAIDPARVRSPQDKGRVERTVPFVRRSFFAGETFGDLADAQRRAECWCRERAGMRVHGTIQARPAEVFRLEEAPALRPAPATPYDLPLYVSAKVHRDHHIEVSRALYSVPGDLIGARVEVRADASSCASSTRGQLVKVHPRQQPGRRGHRRQRPPVGEDRLRPARRRSPPAHGGRPRGGDRGVRRCAVVGAASVDPHAPGLRARGARHQVGRRPGRGRLPKGPRGGSRQRSPDWALERVTEATPEESPPAGMVIPARFARPPEHFGITKKPDPSIGDGAPSGVEAKSHQGFCRDVAGDAG